MRSENKDLRTCSMILLAISFTFAGCAFGTRDSLLRYPPQSEAGAVPTAQAATTPEPKKAEIVLVAFNDQRQDKRLIGTVRNGFYMRTADVVATNSVPEWVFEATKNELNKAGYTVISKVEGPQTQAILSGDIVNVFCDAYFTYNGQVSLHVKLNKNGKDILSKSYLGKGSAGMNWAATSDAYAQSLALALSDALKQMVSDLNASLQTE
jgi:hypothetical protein